MTTTEVDNWPGDVEGLMGPALMERMRQHAQRFAIEIVERSHPHRRLLAAAARGSRARTGATPATRWSSRPAPRPATSACQSEEALRGQGVSACATCDGFFFRNQNVAVVGGGNTAVEEALYLSNLASHVTLIHRRDRLRAEKILQDRLFARERPARSACCGTTWSTRCSATTCGASRCARRACGGRRGTRLCRCTGLFIAVGHTPNTQIFAGQLDDAGGYITIQGGADGNATATSIPGVFAAGDVTDHIYRQAITSAGSGCMAALDADRYLEGVPDGHGG